MLTPEQKIIRMVKVSYCAALIDGEGCLFVHSGLARSHGREYMQTLIHCIVSMSDFDSVSMMAETFGGEVNPQNRQGKLHWRWVLCSDKAAEAVQEMLPYLRGKREQAELFLGYYEIWKAGKAKHHRDYSLLNLIEAKIKELRKVPFTEDYPPATTEREDLSEMKGCDSLNSCGNEPGESAEMTDRLN